MAAFLFDLGLATLQSAKCIQLLPSWRVGVRAPCICFASNLARIGYKSLSQRTRPRYEMVAVRY